ncbi:MAG: hypothetical protein JO076_17755 [Verrucomicrobia bacterium]|nr:hypothetical protein [Verrucomicrobiota bacterium]
MKKRMWAKTEARGVLTQGPGAEWPKYRSEELRQKTLRQKRHYHWSHRIYEPDHPEYEK